MKHCPNCGAQIADDSRFCTECGKEITQTNACPHCGASVGDGDAFCQSCGKSLNEAPSGESVVYEEEVSKSGFKKYLPYIIGGILLFGIIGYCSSNKLSSIEDDNSNDKNLVTDTIEETNREKTDGKDYSETDIKNAVESMYKEYFSTKNEADFDNKYTSAEYKSLYKKAESLADDAFLFVNHWTNSQDIDRPSVKNISVIKQSDNEATAQITVKLFEDSEFVSQVSLALINEGGRWVVDDFLTDEDGNDYSEKAYLKEIINEAQSKPKPLDDAEELTSNGSNSYDEDNYSNNSPRMFANEQYVTMYLANQTFRSSDGFTIRFDGDLRMYAEGDFAGVVSVSYYNSRSAMLRYGGGQYSEGRVRVDIVGDKLQLTDPEDGSVYYQR